MGKLETRNSKFEIIARAKSRTYIIILIVIALILGYAIYNQQKVNISKNTATKPLTATPVPFPANLTEDEKFILNPPPATASAEIKKKHADTVAKLAKEEDNLEIKDCQPTPLVLQVKQGTEFTIQNKDSSPHKIIFDSDHHYVLPANGSKTIKADFKYGSGDYGYICEEVGLTGFLHITP